MQDPNLLELESLFLALGDKTRLRLLSLMADGPVAVGFLAEQLKESQPKVSRHLAYLRHAGVVSTERDGKYVYYRIEVPTDARVNYVLGALMESLTATGPKNGGSVQVKSIREKPVEQPPDAPTDMQMIADDEPEDHVSRDERDELEIFLL